jgi:hypothetical protein
VRGGVSKYIRPPGSRNIRHEAAERFSFAGVSAANEKIKFSATSAFRERRAVSMLLNLKTAYETRPVVRMLVDFAPWKKY